MINHGVLIRLNGQTETVILTRHDSQYYVDEDGDVFQRADERYDSLVPGWWVTYVEQKTTY